MPFKVLAAQRACVQAAESYLAEAVQQPRLVGAVAEPGVADIARVWPISTALFAAITAATVANRSEPNQVAVTGLYDPLS